MSEVNILTASRCIIDKKSKNEGCVGIIHDIYRRIEVVSQPLIDSYLKVIVIRTTLVYFGCRLARN